MATAGSLKKLISYIERTEWAEELSIVLTEHLAPAMLRFEIDPEEVADYFDEVHLQILGGCALEDLMARDDADGRNVVDEYLKRRGYAEGGGAKRYMRAIRQSVMSLYEVSDVVPNHSFLARDRIRGGKPVRVSERKGTTQLKAWDHIAARLVRLGSEWQMAGGIHVFDRKTAEWLVTELKKPPEEFLAAAADAIKVRPVGSTSPLSLDRAMAGAVRPDWAAPLFSTVWLSSTLERILDPQPLQLRNSDGDTIVSCTSTFPLRPDAKVAQCRKALTAVPELHADGAKRFDWVAAPGDDKVAAAKARIEDTAESTSTIGGGASLLGSITFKKGAIELWTNSCQRAGRGEAMIAAALATLAGLPERVEETVDDLKAKRGQPSGSRTRRPTSEVPPEIARTVIHDYLDQHYRRTIDQPIAILGGVTPRAAARSDAGRARVVAWLKDMENHAARASGGDEAMASYDFGWVWRELGVADLRE